MRHSLVILLLAGCTDSALDDDRAFRRLVDSYDTYDQCLADTPIVSCYQTLVLCTNGRVFIDLDNRPKDGSYELDGSMATVRVAGEQILFDLDKRSSPQLPGRHPWEVATPSFTGCDTE